MNEEVFNLVSRTSNQHIFILLSQTHTSQVNNRWIFDLGVFWNFSRRKSGLAWRSWGLDRDPLQEAYIIARYFQVIFLSVVSDLQLSGPTALHSYTPKIQFMDWFRYLGVGKTSSGSSWVDFIYNIQDFVRTLIGICSPYYKATKAYFLLIICSISMVYLCYSTRMSTYIIVLFAKYSVSVPLCIFEDIYIHIGTHLYTYMYWIQNQHVMFFCFFQTSGTEKWLATDKMAYWLIIQPMWWFAQMCTTTNN